MFIILIVCGLPIFADTVASGVTTATNPCNSTAFLSSLELTNLNPVQDEEISGQQSTEHAKVELDQPKTWPKHAPQDSRMEFQMPKRPRLSERTFTPVEGQAAIRVRNYVGSYDESKIVLVASFHDLPVLPEEKKLIQETLEGAMTGSILNLNGKLIESKAIRYADNPGLEYVFRFAANENIYQGIGRVFLVGQRQYMISAMMLEEKFDQEISDGFLGSLRLIEENGKSENNPSESNQIESEG